MPPAGAAGKILGRHGGADRLPRDATALITTDVIRVIPRDVGRHQMSVERANRDLRGVDEREMG